MVQKSEEMRMAVIEHGDTVEAARSTAQPIEIIFSLQIGSLKEKRVKNIVILIKIL